MDKRIKINNLHIMYFKYVYTVPTCTLYMYSTMYNNNTIMQHTKSMFLSERKNFFYFFKKKYNFSPFDCEYRFKKKIIIFSYFKICNS